MAVSRRDLLFGTPGISVHGTDSPANASTTAPATPPADQSLLKLTATAIAVVSSQ